MTTLGERVDGDGDSLSAMLLNVYTYYAQFIDAHANRLAAERAPLDKQLLDYLSVTRWDDRNYERLQASAAAAHRKLASLAHKWCVF